METGKVLYGLEPDLCISNPDLLVNAVNDVILPTYFHTQLQYLKNSNLAEASDAAHKILDSLSQIDRAEIIIYQNQQGCNIYFVDELNHDLSPSIFPQIDLENPLDRYLLTLDKLADIFQAQVFFCTHFSQNIQKYQVLHFSVIRLEDGEWDSKNQVWLHQEMVVNAMNDLDRTSKIQWEEQETEQPEDKIYWQDVVTSNNSIEWTDMTDNPPVSSQASSLSSVSVSSESEEETEPHRQLTEAEMRVLEEQRQQRRQQLLTEKAREWLNNLDPNSDEGRWFEEYSHSYESKLQAAIVYLESMREAGHHI